MDMRHVLRPLALVTAASLALAFIALIGERRINAVPPPQTLLPTYAATLANAQKLDITHGMGMSGTRALTLSRGAKGWTLDQRWGYPANDELVNETLLALADLKAVEARTAKADWHRALGLVVPENFGAAVRFRVTDKAGAEMASLLLGKEQQSEAEAKQQVQNYGPELRQFYVRRADSDQTWLARGRLPRNSEPAAWIDPSLPRHAPEKLQQVRFGKARDKSGAAFKFIRVGDAWSLAGAQSWLDRFQALRPNDVARADSINFETARPFTLSYADGLSITYENVGAATVIWSRMRARAEAEASAEVTALAAALTARFDGWAMRFAAERSPILLPAQADLTR
jgi:hypothetical protein